MKAETCKHDWTNLHNEKSDAYCLTCSVIGVPCDLCDGDGQFEEYAPEDLGDVHDCPRCAGSGLEAYRPFAFHSHSPFALQRT